MCMSTAYENRDGKENFIADYIREAKVEGDQVTFVDITGKQTTITGVIRTVDLVRNVILIESV